MGFLAWDFDGTLGYREGLWSSALLTALREAGQASGIDADRLRAELRTGFPWHTPEVSHAELSSPELWWRALTPVFVRAFEAGGLDRAAARTLAGHVRGIYTDPSHWCLFDDAIPALRLLSSRGWSHVVLSNHVPKLARIITALGLDEHVLQVFNSATGGYEKPYPRAFVDLLEALGRPEKIWMIGDDLTADVRGAEAAGIPTILVRGVRGGALFHCKDLTEVATVVGQA